MGIYETLRRDWNIAKKRQASTATTYSYIISELSRDKNKKAHELTDAEILAIMKILRNKEKEMLKEIGEHESNSMFLAVLNIYLPPEMTKQEIKEYIERSIDLSEFKNKMQAMKPIMAQIGYRADGKLVKEVIMEID